MPRRLSPALRAWSRNVKGRFLATVVSHIDSLAISTGHRVAVHAVAAVLGHQAAGFDHNVEPVRVVCCGGGLSATGVAFGSPRLDEPVREVAAGGDEDGPRSDGRVADLEIEDVGCGPDAPLVRVGGVLGAW